MDKQGFLDFCDEWIAEMDGALWEATSNPGDHSNTIAMITRVRAFVVGLREWCDYHY